MLYRSFVFVFVFAFVFCLFAFLLEHRLAPCNLPNKKHHQACVSRGIWELEEFPGSIFYWLGMEWWVMCEVPLPGG